MNNLEGLKDCIYSIKSQTYNNFEVWIIDCNSTDGSLNFMKTLDIPFYWLSEPDNGIYDAMNKGIKKANGDWLFFLGSDDKLYSENVLMNIFSNLDYGGDVISGKIKYDLNKRDSIVLKNNKGIFKSSWSNFMWIKNTVHHQSVFYNKRIFKNLNYHISFEILSDYYLNLELLIKAIKVKYVDEIVSICGTNGVSKNYDWKLYKEEIDLKVALSSLIFKPLFFVISMMKYLFKNLT